MPHLAKKMNSYQVLITFLSYFCRTMRNLLCITITVLLFSYGTCAKDLWEEMGVTCEKESEVVSIAICGGEEHEVKKCRGTCKSISRITTTSPWYKMDCKCCKATKFEEVDIHCRNGRKKKTKQPKSCSCSACHGA